MIVDGAVQVIGVDLAAQMFRDIGDQALFAQAQTLNGLANTTQAVVRDSLDEWATLRRPEFVRNTIYRKPVEDFATKARLQAGVRVHPERNFLAKFEAGGEKTGRDGHRIAIPIDVRRNKNEVVTAANRPRKLLTKKGVALADGVIVQRIKQGAARVTRLLYLLKDSVRIAPKLRMAEHAQDVARLDFVPIASEAIDRALSTARRK